LANKKDGNTPSWEKKNWKFSCFTVRKSDLLSVRGDSQAKPNLNEKSSRNRGGLYC